MKIDFNIVHTFTPLVNSLNLNYEDAKRQYESRNRSNSHTFDPVPNPDGKEYDFNHHGPSPANLFRRDLVNGNNTAYIIAHTNNKENYLNPTSRIAYHDIIHQDNKAFFGLWVNPVGTSFLDTSSLYDKINDQHALQLRDDYNQQSIIKIDSKGKVSFL